MKFLSIRKLSTVVAMALLGTVLADAQSDPEQLTPILAQPMQPPPGPLLGQGVVAPGDAKLTFPLPTERRAAARADRPKVAVLREQEIGRAHV